MRFEPVTSRARRGALPRALAGLALTLPPGLLAAGCGGGGGGSGGAIAPVITASAAAHLLTQATFGPTPEELERVQLLGEAAWVDEQLALPATSHLEHLDAYGQGQDPASGLRVDTWWHMAMRAPDQLRQRVAFALSQLFVVSEVEITGAQATRGLANYYDVLARGAFGPYRRLLEDVTLSPVMGVYLSHVKNERADAARNVRPDENYAREVMQLFSIGLVELGFDGVPRRDGAGQTIPTYDQATVEGFAQVFTGWTYAGARSWNNAPRNLLEPMISFQQWHDTSEKRLLGGRVLPAGRTAEQDLADALDVLAQHPNTGPFVCRHLIQRLVTSNPGPDYMRRVVQAWEDDGRGQRGNLGAVVRAILLDPEARRAPDLQPAEWGKVREPLLRVSALWRAFGAQPVVGRYGYQNPERELAQAPLRAPSVFNFFRPNHRPPGELSDLGLDAPETQLATETTTTATTNRFYTLVHERWDGVPRSLGPDEVILSLAPLRPLAGDPEALVDRVGLLLLGGRRTPPDMRQTVLDLVRATPLTDDGTQRALEAIWIVVTSPEFAVQR